MNSFYNLILKTIENIIYDVHTSIPAIITQINTENQTISAKPAVKRFYIEDNQEKFIEYQTIQNIPYLSMYGGNYVITIPPAVGDNCLLLYSERNIDQYKKTAEISEIKDFKRRHHNTNDAIAIVGLTPATKNIKDYNPDQIQIRNLENTISISLAQDNIILKNDKTELTVNKDSLNINTDNVNITASNNINLSAQTMSLAGDVNIDGSLSADEIKTSELRVNGRATVAGDLDVNTIQDMPYPPPTRNLIVIDGKEVEEATQGYLITHFLPTFEQLELTLPEIINFNINLSGQYRNISFMRESVNSIDEIAKAIHESIKDIANCEYILDSRKEYIQITTLGKGKDLGAISYMEDIADIYPAEHGKLTTGDIILSDVNSVLNNKGLKFKILTSNKMLTYIVDNNSVDSIEHLSSILGAQNSSYINVTSNNNSLVFTSVDIENVGEMINVYHGKEPAIITSGVFDKSINELIAESISLNLKTVAISSFINNIKHIFVCDINESWMSYNDMFNDLFYHDDIKWIFDNNILSIYTNNKGEENTITFFKCETSVNATQSKLITGNISISLNELKEIYDNQSYNIGMFYFNINGIKLEYSLTKETLNNISSFEELALSIQTSLPQVKCSYINNTFELISVDFGVIDISYMMHDNSDSLPLNLLLSGTEIQNASIITGTNAKNDVFINIMNYIKLDQNNASIVNGSDSIYYNNTNELLHGTKEKGAIINEAKEEYKSIINESATALKGTKETSATLVIGVDDGEDIDFGEPFDGKTTLKGNLEVTDTITAKNINITDSSTLSGDVTINPTDRVIINGDISVEIADVSTLNVNNNAIIHSDIDLSGKINANYGITTEYTEDGMVVNNEIIAEDLIAK